MNSMLFRLNNFAAVDIDAVTNIAKQAGKAIMEVYEYPEEKIAIKYKSDQSPLTIADAVAHDIIAAQLNLLTPGIPVLSEEGKDIPFEIRKNWEYYWCVDPLDGTKEFIKRNGEFTVNIALIHRDTPVLGVICVPVTGVLYFGGLNIGSWKITGDNQKQLFALPKINNLVAVGSRTHSSAEEIEILGQYQVSKTIEVGSSLKFCMIAEGSAQIYYRHGPTMEWDTAAGHAIAKYSGAHITQPNGEVFYYNKPSLLNGSFICKA